MNIKTALETSHLIMRKKKFHLELSLPVKNHNFMSERIPKFGARYSFRGRIIGAPNRRVVPVSVGLA